MAIHVAITRQVIPGCEQAFEESLRELFQESLGYKGVLGVHLLSPSPGSHSREYGILRTFSNERERDAFYRSELFAKWQKDVARLTEGPRTSREVHSLEAWFRTPESPPKWKMAFLTWLGVWPTIWIVSRFLVPRLSGLPQLFGSAIATAVVVACLTWLVMPLLVRLFSLWLHLKT